MDFTRNTSSKKCPSTILGLEKTPKKEKKSKTYKKTKLGQALRSANQHFNSANWHYELGPNAFGSNLDPSDSMF